MSFHLTYNQGVTTPSAKLWIYDDDGTLLDLSAASGFVVKIGARKQAAKLSKSAGIAGAVGAGTEPTGTPNLVITWSGTELNIAPGTWLIQVSMSSGARMWEGEIEILANIA